MLLVAAIGLVLALVLVTRSMVVVPDGFAFVVERLGRFERVLTPGLHIVLPFVSTVRARVPLGAQTVDIAPAPCVTRDNTAATCGGSVKVQVIDVVRAVTLVASYRDAVAQVMARAWAEAIAASDAASAPGAVRTAHAGAEATLAGWGIKILEARPQFTPSADAMRQAVGRSEPAPSTAAPAFASGAAPTAIQFAVARGSIAPGELGIVEAGGRDWAARNISATAIARGFRCAVERQEGETLFVRAK